MATGGRPRGRKTRVSLTEILEPGDQERARLLSRLYASFASEREELIGIRQRLFGGRTLTPEEAHILAAQVAPRFFPMKWFEDNEIPLIGHRSFYFDPERGATPIDSTVAMVIRLEWDNGRSMDIPHAARLSDEARMDGVKIVLPARAIQVISNSVLGGIQAVASRLARHYLWSEIASTWFVLTGDPPPVLAIGVRSVGGWTDDHTRFAFELLVEPWVSAKSVKRAFQHLQRDAYGHQVQPRRPRAFKLLEFVEDYREQHIGKTWREIREQGVDFPWTKVTQLWNKTHGEKHFDYTPNNLSRDFLVAWNALVNPPVKPLVYRREVKQEE